MGGQALDDADQMGNVRRKRLLLHLEKIDADRKCNCGCNGEDDRTDSAVSRA